MNPVLIFNSLKNSIKKHGGLKRVARRAAIQIKYRGIKNVVLESLSKYRDGFDYQKWLSKYEKGIVKDYSISSDNSAFVFHIVVLVATERENNKKRLLQTIKSATCQSYKKINIYVCGRESNVSELKTYIDREMGFSCESKMSFCTFNNLHGQKLCNLKETDWLVFLACGDKLHEQAIENVFVAVYPVVKRGYKLVYTDEDQVGKDGQRVLPNFKPDWNPDLFFSSNFIGNACFFRGDVVSRMVMDGSFQDWKSSFDFILSLLPGIESQEIYHLPKVLYHCASDVSCDDRCQDDVKSLKKYFENEGEITEILPGLVPATYNISWKMKVLPLVTLIMPMRNALDLTEQAVTSILEKTTYRNFELLIVDNNSDDPDCLKYLKDIERNNNIRVIKYPNPFNFSAINNFAVGHAYGDIIGLINNDVEVISPNWLDVMVSHAMRKGIGCVGAKLYYPNNTIQHAGIVTGLGGVAGHIHKNFPRNSNGYCGRLMVVQNFSAVTAACLLVRSEIYEEVGGMEEKHLAVAFNDVDFCLKVKRAGYRNLWTPYAELYHYESLSRGYEDTAEKISRFEAEVKYMREKWPKECQEDDAYNPNLSRIFDNFALAFPPATYLS